MLVHEQLPMQRPAQQNEPELGKNKHAEATVSKRPIPNFAVEEFKKIVAGESESQDPVLLIEQMQKWWAEPQRGQFLVTQCALL